MWPGAGRIGVCSGQLHRNSCCLTGVWDTMIRNAYSGTRCFLYPMPGGSPPALIRFSYKGFVLVEVTLSSKSFRTRCHGARMWPGAGRIGVCSGQLHRNSCCLTGVWDTMIRNAYSDTRCFLYPMPGGSHPALIRSCYKGFVLVELTLSSKSFRTRCHGARMWPGAGRIGVCSGQLHRNSCCLTGVWDTMIRNAYSSTRGFLYPMPGGSPPALIRSSHQCVVLVELTLSSKSFRTRCHGARMWPGAGRIGVCSGQLHRNSCCLTGVWDTMIRNAYSGTRGFLDPMPGGSPPALIRSSYQCVVLVELTLSSKSFRTRCHSARMWPGAGRIGVCSGQLHRNSCCLTGVWDTMIRNAYS